MRNVVSEWTIPSSERSLTTPRMTSTSPSLRERYDDILLTRRSATAEEVSTDSFLWVKNLSSGDAPRDSR